ncbi:MAG: 4a-hydroxytetrahydrobiopterin dehydratase [Acidimicrobiales bacterium]|nr:4a-hydroxytetrahydrobiopterin dehydratase [Acidimicrobiales bacterium]MCB9373468.1 4a-hydroxytetrahydrobiopterin dehydratase [Microthrixaceae bacterium]
MPRYTPVTAADIAADDSLADWRVIVRTLHADFVAPGFSAGAALVRSIAEAADAADHHPDVDLRWPGRVHVALSTHATGGLSDADVSLARTISRLAGEAGATPEPTVLQTSDVAIDTLDADAIRPFWKAVLDYREQGDDLVDPRGVGMTVWFQSMDEPRTERNRLHIDVNVPHDRAEARVEAAVAAGGRLVTDRFAPAWWVLADAEGNEACVCTWQDEAAGA